MFLTLTKTKRFAPKSLRKSRFTESQIKQTVLQTVTTKISFKKL